MPFPSPRRPVRVVAAAIAAVALCAAPAAGQTLGPPPPSRTHFGVGFAGNVPDAVLGGAAYLLLPARGGIGLYVDAKFDTDTPRGAVEWVDGFTSRQITSTIGGRYVRHEATWRSVNAAVVRPLAPSLMAYVGGGVARARYYHLIVDLPQEGPVGFGGVAWAESPEDASTGVNFMVGIMLRMSSLINGHFGYETRPQGLTLGASLRLPPW